MGGLPNVHVVDDGDKDRGFMDFVVFGGKSRTKEVVLRDHQSINMKVPQVLHFSQKNGHHITFPILFKVGPSLLGVAN